MNLNAALSSHRSLAVSLPVVAADINQIQTLTQDEFHRLSRTSARAVVQPLTPHRALASRDSTWASR